MNYPPPSSRLKSFESSSAKTWQKWYVLFLSLEFVLSSSIFFSVDRPTYQWHCGWYFLLQARYSHAWFRSRLRNSWQSLDPLHTDWTWLVTSNLEGLNTSTRVVTWRRAKAVTTVAPILVYVSREDVNVPNMNVFVLVLGQLNNATTITKPLDAPNQFLFHIAFHFQPLQCQHILQCE